MRQTFLVTILLCVLAVPAALLSSWAPQPQRVTAVAEPQRQGAISQMLAHPKPVINMNSAAAKTRLMTLVARFAMGARNLRALAPKSDNAVSWVTATPKAVTQTAAALLYAVADARAQAQPVAVGSGASGVVPVSGNAMRSEPTGPSDAGPVNWHLLANDPSDAEARYAIGMSYLTGKDVAQDYGMAAHWLTGSAERGDARAALALADLYVEGTGVDRSYVTAARWYEIAARGLPNDGTRSAAMAKRDRILGAMTAEERKIAEAAVQH
jgi:TPR repeat protein